MSSEPIWPLVIKAVVAWVSAFANFGVLIWAIRLNRKANNK